MTAEIPKEKKKRHPVTPDGRYFVVKERLWRCTNPALPDDIRRSLIKQLMKARLAVKHANTEDETRAARAAVDAAKIALGERGPVWWSDGAPDVNRYHPKNTVYADWWEEVSESDKLDFSVIERYQVKPPHRMHDTGGY